MFHLRPDVFKTSMGVYPLQTSLLIITICVNLGLSIKVTCQSFRSTRKQFFVALLFISIYLTLSNPFSQFFITASEYHHNKSNSIYSVFSQPELTQNISAKPGKNLVLIYLESLEKNYLDNSIFPKLTPNLNRLAKEGIFLDNFQQTPSTGFTVAGIFASQCGVPLSGGNNDVLFQSQYGNIACLSDILGAAGYQQVYYGGANTEFSGKKNFLKQHGYDEVYGLKELKKKIDPSQHKKKIHGWGVHDTDTLDFALTEYKSLSEAQVPFNLTVLTLDTHHPNGHPDPRCPVYELEANNSLLNSVHCTDYLLGKFLAELQQQPNWEDTVVMIMSDHLAMRNIVSERLEKGQNRLLTGLILNSQLEAAFHPEPVYHMDILDTLLNSMEVSHDQSFINSYDLSKRIGVLEHPSKTQGSKNIKIKNSEFLRSKKEKVPTCANEITFNVSKDTGATIRIDSHTIPMTRNGHIKKNPNGERIYIVEFNQDETINFAKYISQSELKTYLDSSIKNRYLLVTKKNSLNGTSLDTLAEKGLFSRNPWVAYFRIDDKNTLVDSSSSFKKLKIQTPDCQVDTSKIARVAHAGGGINNHTYTNSFEALNLNKSKNYKYFELDFSFTSDNHLVCLHDWEGSFERSFKIESTGKVSLSKFNQLVQENSTFTKCNLETLIQWIDKNPEARIVTDVKEKNLQALHIIAKQYPKYIDNFIPQVYFPEEIKPTKKLGYKNIIWTLYRYSGNHEKVLNTAKIHKLNLFAITMPHGKARSTLPSKLAALGIPTYAHTINNEEHLFDLQNTQKVTEIYSDFLSPSNPKSLN